MVEENCIYTNTSCSKKHSTNSDSGYEDSMSTSSIVDSVHAVNQSVENSKQPSDKAAESKYLENKRKKVNINKSDLAKLTGPYWLNDNVINSYLDLIQQRSQDNSNLPRTHCFNTYFYTKLASKGYGSVRRWTKKVDIFQKDVLIVPCHVSKSHWTLTVVDLNNRKIIYYDSLGAEDHGILNLIASYLQQESLDKRGIKLDISEWEIFSRGKSSPQQNNSYDCGVFTIVTAELISRNEKVLISQEDMRMYRARIYSELSNGEIKADKNQTFDNKTDISLQSSIPIVEENNINSNSSSCCTIKVVKTTQPETTNECEIDFLPKTLKESSNICTATEENYENTNLPIELPGDGLNRRFLFNGEILIETNGCYIYQRELDQAAEYQKYLEDWLDSVTS